MKNKWVIIAVVILAVSGVAYYLNWLGGSEDSAADYVPAVNDLPALNITKPDGSTVSLRSVSGKVVLIFFNPDCDHCQREATQISERKQVFRNHAVYFISIDPMDSIVKFSRNYNLIENNFLFTQANGDDVYNTVGPLPSVPAIFIYDDKKFIKRLEGEVKLEEIMKYL
jgi:thiol-disulfide isomerase/thioredoxin